MTVFGRLMAVCVTALTLGGCITFSMAPFKQDEGVRIPLALGVYSCGNYQYEDHFDGKPPTVKTEVISVEVFASTGQSGRGHYYTFLRKPSHDSDIIAFHHAGGNNFVVQHIGGKHADGTNFFTARIDRNAATLYENRLGDATKALAAKHGVELTGHNEFEVTGGDEEKQRAFMYALATNNPDGRMLFDCRAVNPV